MKKLQALLLMISLVITLSCSKKEEPTKTEASNEQKAAEQKSQAQKSELENTIDYLTSDKLGGRKYNSPGAEKAAQYIADKFKEYGLKPAGENGTYFQKFKDGTNVLGMLPGTADENAKINIKAQIVVLAAHHDAFGMKDGKMCRGADDNASGVAVLIDTVRQFQETGRKPHRSILFISFDAEEAFMLGSAHFVNSGLYDMKKISTMICMDLVGGNLFGWDAINLYAFGTEYFRKGNTGITVSSAIDFARRRPNIGKKTPLTQTDIKMVNNPDYLKSKVDLRGININIIEMSSYLIEPLGSARSDYGPFRNKGIPYVFFSTGTPWYYHTPDDTKDKIDFKKLDNVSDFIFNFVTTIAEPLVERYDFTPDPVPLPRDVGPLLDTIDKLLMPKYKSVIAATRVTQLEELKPKLEEIIKKLQEVKDLNITTEDGRKTIESIIDKTIMQKAVATIMAIARDIKNESVSDK